MKMVRTSHYQIFCPWLHQRLPVRANFILWRPFHFSLCKPLYFVGLGLYWWISVNNSHVWCVCTGHSHSCVQSFIMITASLHVCQIILGHIRHFSKWGCSLYNFVPESTVLHQPSLGFHQPNDHAWCSFPQMVIPWEFLSIFLSLTTVPGNPGHDWYSKYGTAASMHDSSHPRGRRLIPLTWETPILHSQVSFQQGAFSTNVTKYSVRADSGFAPSQWETALLCNDVSHWLGANLDRISSAVCIHQRLGNNKYLIASDLKIHLIRKS